MKTIIIIMFFVASITVFASNDFKVTAEPSLDAKVVTIKFKTKKTFSSICFLDVTKIEMTLGEVDMTSHARLDGKISLSASHNPLDPCLMAFGPHSGATDFKAGSQLPELSLGKYQLFINEND
ncbi:MAG: hypothetical protein HY843_06005 [Bdellovibrio sp.]|nr:hypothetical protein [Bdellovibrio sp.]